MDNQTYEKTRNRARNRALQAALAMDEFLGIIGKNVLDEVPNVSKPRLSAADFKFLKQCGIGGFNAEGTGRSSGDGKEESTAS
jgi:hypothetical protein